MRRASPWILCVILALAAAKPGRGQEQLSAGEPLEQQLARESPAALARAARQDGDARLGAILFHQPVLLCTTCHAAGTETNPLGPDLANAGVEMTDTYLVESLLAPSKAIREGYEPIVVVTDEGKTVTGLRVEDGATELVLRDVDHEGKLVTLAKDEIEARRTGDTSVMPAGLVNQLASRQQFLDLVRYLMEIAEHGPARARELRPAASLYAARPLPEYENDIDHAGMIAELDRKSFRRGEAIYNRLCANCHGTHDRAGSLPTSPRFASAKLKNGSDPHGMYRTLTHGFGMMVPQAWMVPQQKYDVIHYIREAYFKDSNPSQYVPVDRNYLAGLPKGTSRGPSPSTMEPWSNMDYGPNLIATYEVGRDGSNFAYKGIAIRLDAGPGGVSRGRHWMLYDHDTLRVAAAWSGEGFIDYNGVMFTGQHDVHPRPVGQVQFANPAGPGWGDPANGSFDDPRLRGRDDRPYGPLPRRWAHYRGLYHFSNHVVVSYTVGGVPVLELPGVQIRSSHPVYTRTLNVGPRSRDLLLAVAHRPGAKLRMAQLGEIAPETVAVLGPGEANRADRDDGKVIFGGAAAVEVDAPDDFDLTDGDYTITARVRTRSGGSVFSKTAPDGPWVENGKSLFIDESGELVFDIGWVGEVRSRRSITDNRWHNVAVAYRHRAGDVRLYIDGRPDGRGNLKPEGEVDGHVVRIGYTSPDFPEKQPYFVGGIGEVRFYDRALGRDELRGTGTATATGDDGLVARWDFAGKSGAVARDTTGNGHDGRIVGRDTQFLRTGVLAAGVAGDEFDATWVAGDDGQLRLKIPAGDDPLRFTLWTSHLDALSELDALAPLAEMNGAAMDLTPLTKGGPPRWSEKLATTARLGSEDGPFAVDVLVDPVANPWFCRMRFTGLDFFPDADRLAACTWDGDVWLVRGIDRPEHGLTWQRIASGLFQPLGLKIVDGRIYVACRDQIAILHDLNGDGEADFYENFNNDHQVTEHFHEFAMGLQTDAEGNFYYAKSARHARTALVPHHGTLLRVSKDGSRTDIVATGFRAANGVCVNPDGTFIVTDQEGHWNPKNRVNWVREGGFYGNMMGYHDVTDESDSAMEQPLCWITNEFDRSPAELLWVESQAWGPLQGSLLNLSYGYGKVYVVPHEEVSGQMQGGMCALPIAQFPTGVMRGRFHPGNGQLYLCGMYSWASNQQQPGGFYRLRYTGKAVFLPIGLEAGRKGMAITFSGTLDAKSAGDPANYAVKTWSLKRTARYGSAHYNQRPSEVTGARLSADGRTVFLEIPEIAPTWCMEIKYSIKGSNGEPVDGAIHNTIHALR